MWVCLNIHSQSLNSRLHGSQSETHCVSIRSVQLVALVCLLVKQLHGLSISPKPYSWAMFHRLHHRRTESRLCRPVKFRLQMKWKSKPLNSIRPTNRSIFTLWSQFLVALHQVRSLQCERPLRCLRQNDADLATIH
ncbi:hypothetical protein M3Y94_00081900 [Aphelenchoides besseyi]|nr:hypothetical protein M3Y94_00081900 [Aphelenchoides besseyi]